MDEIRGSVFKMKKKIKGQLKGSGRKPERMGAGAEGEGASSTSSFPRPAYPHVVVAGGHNREGRGVDIEGRESSQRNLYPDVKVVVESGPGREGNDIGGEKTDRLDPPPLMPSISYNDSTWRGSIQSLSLIGFLDNADDSAVSDQVQEDLGSNESEPNAAEKSKSNWKSTASATAKLLLRGVKESADAFPPLKSVTGGLCFILESYEVRPYFPTHHSRSLQVFQQTKANEHALESLAHGVNALFASLCTPVSEGDVKEELRRKELGR